jgi:hypothetical protein
MTSVEAYTRLHGYPIVRKSHTVTKLYVHGPDDQKLMHSDEAGEEEIKQVLRAKPHKTKLLAFFELCAREKLVKRMGLGGKDARLCHYYEIPKYFWFNKYVDRQNHL